MIFYDTCALINNLENILSNDSIFAISSITLDELEKIITAHEFIRECAVVKFEQKGREFIGAMLVLSDTGRRELSSVTHGRFFIRLRNELGRVMIKLTVPRRFIITDELPLTDSRKIAYKKVERAFYHESA